MNGVPGLWSAEYAICCIQRCILITNNNSNTSVHQLDRKSRPLHHSVMRNANDCFYLSSLKFVVVSIPLFLLPPTFTMTQNTSFPLVLDAPEVTKSNCTAVVIWAVSWRREICKSSATVTAVNSNGHQTWPDYRNRRRSACMVADHVHSLQAS